jgi:hypothetical protein
MLWKHQRSPLTTVKGKHADGLLRTIKRGLAPGQDVVYAKKPTKSQIYIALWK